MPQTTHTLNPILPGMSADPTILRHNSIYYLCTSSFHLFPGLPIYSSPDLLVWTHISNAISRPSQLSLSKSATLLKPPRHDPRSKLAYTGGLYAPTLRYHAGTFYLLCTNVINDGGAESSALQNFILTTDDIEKGQWSDPLYFDFQGIDPSIYFSDAGQVIITGSRVPGPETRINQFEIDLKTGRRLSEGKTIWTGALQRFPEAPHLYMREGWYYLVIAEGGTQDGHCVNVARSKSIWGPFEGYEMNPILSVAGDEEDVQCTGHADFFQDRIGNWWSVLLGVRKRSGGSRFVMGRETFLTKVNWQESGWPKLEKVELEIEGLSKKGNGVPEMKDRGLDFISLRRAPEECEILDGGRLVSIKPSMGDLDQWQEPVSFVGKRQRLLEGYSRVELKIPPAGVTAGLTVYKDEHRSLRISVDASQQEIRWQILNRAKDISQTSEVPLDESAAIGLQIRYTEETYVLSWKAKSSIKWQLLAEIDGEQISGPDFVGPLVGIFAVGKNEEAVVEFENFVVDQTDT